MRGMHTVTLKKIALQHLSEVQHSCLPPQLQGGRVPRRREPPGLRKEPEGAGGHQGRRVGPPVH